jgi:hypothetical protein
MIVHCHINCCISRYDLNLVTFAVDQELMHRERDVTIGMYPISLKQHAI